MSCRQRRQNVCRHGRDLGVSNTSRHIGHCVMSLIRRRIAIDDAIRRNLVQHQKSGNLTVKLAAYACTAGLCIATIIATMTMPAKALAYAQARHRKQAMRFVHACRQPWTPIHVVACACQWITIRSSHIGYRPNHRLFTKDFLFASYTKACTVDL